jgi:hypothetical protein
VRSEEEVLETAKRLLAEGADVVHVDLAIETAKDDEDRRFWEAVARKMGEIVARESAQEDGVTRRPKPDAL